MSAESIKDDALTVFDLSRARLEDLEITAKWYFESKQTDFIDFEAFLKYVKTVVAKVKDYMFLNRKYDYARSIEEFGKLKIESIPEIEVLIVDEAQDLSKAQWKCIELLSAHTKRIYVAGDDDQAIFQWNGGDVDSFISVAEQGNVEVLGQSYRLPGAAHKVATSISNRISNSIEKTYAPKELQGFGHLLNPKTANFKEGDWLVLATTKAQLKDFGTALEAVGVPYTYYGVRNVNSAYIEDFIADVQPHETDKARRRAYEILKRQQQAGYDIQAIPNVELYTTYVVKGDERENVIVLNGVSTPDTKDVDALHRVMYVSVSRAAERLFVVDCVNAKHRYPISGLDYVSLKNLIGVEVPDNAPTINIKLGGYTPYPGLMKGLMQLYLTGEADPATLLTCIESIDLELADRHMKLLDFDLATLTKVIEEYLKDAVARQSYNSMQARKAREAEVAETKAKRQAEALKQLESINELQVKKVQLAEDAIAIQEKLEAELAEERAARTAQEEAFQAQLNQLQSKFQKGN